MASWQARELRKPGETDEALIDRLADEVFRLNDELLCHSEACGAIEEENATLRAALDRVGWSPSMEAATRSQPFKLPSAVAPVG